MNRLFTIAVAFVCLSLGAFLLPTLAQPPGKLQSPQRVFEEDKKADDKDRDQEKKDNDKVPPVADPVSFDNLEIMRYFSMFSSRPKGSRM